MIFNTVSKACPYIKKASKQSFIIKKNLSQALVYKKSGKQEANMLPNKTVQNSHFGQDTNTIGKNILNKFEQDTQNAYYNNSVSIVSNIKSLKSVRQFITIYQIVRNYITPTILCLGARKLTMLFLATSHKPLGMDEADRKILIQFCKNVVNINTNYLGPEQCYHILFFFRINSSYMQDVFEIQLRRCQDLRKRLLQRILSYQQIIDNIRIIDIFSQFTLHYNDYKKLLNKALNNVEKNQTEKTRIMDQLKKIDQFQYRLIKLCLYKIKEQFQLEIDGPSDNNIGRLLKKLVKPFKTHIIQGPSPKQLQYRLVNISYHLCKGYSVCVERKKIIKSKVSSDKSYLQTLELLNQLFNLFTILLIQGSKYLPTHQLIRTTNKVIGYFLETSPSQEYIRLNYELLQSLVHSIQLSLQKSNRTILQYIQIMNSDKNSDKINYYKQNYQMSKINTDKVIKNQNKIDQTKSIQESNEQLLKSEQELNKQSFDLRIHKFQNQECLKVLKNVKRLIKELKKQLKLDRVSESLKQNRKNPDGIEVVLDVDSNKTNNILIDISKQATKIMKIIEKNKQQMQEQDYLKQFQDIQSRMRSMIEQISNRKVVKEKSQITQGQQAYKLLQKFTQNQRENKGADMNKGSHSLNKNSKKGPKRNPKIK